MIRVMPVTLLPGSAPFTVALRSTVASAERSSGDAAPAGCSASAAPAQPIAKAAAPASPNALQEKRIIAHPVVSPPSGTIT